MLQVYRSVPGSGNRFVYGPADLVGVSDDLVVVGEADELEASRWAAAIGLAVLRGASVRRVWSGKPGEG